MLIGTMRVAAVVLLSLLAGILAMYSNNDYIVELTTSDFQSKVMEGGEPWLIQFYAPWWSACENFAPEWRRAARKLSKIMKVGVVNAAVHSGPVLQFGVDDYPTIKLFGEDKSKPLDYHGVLTADAIVNFSLSQTQGTPRSDLWEGVVEVTDGNFAKEVLGHDKMVMVMFYAPECEHCMKLAPRFSEAAKQLKGKVKLCALDVSSNTITPHRYNIRTVSTIKVFKGGQINDEEPEDYGGLPTSSAIVRWSLKTLAAESSDSKTDVVELSDSKFDREVLGHHGLVLVEFYAPWCSHCGYFTPQWAQAAKELKGKAKLCAIDVSIFQIKAKLYGITNLPAIKVFPAGKKDSEPGDYDGRFSAEGVVKRVLDGLATAADVVEVTNNIILKENCENHHQLCFVSVLPHIYDCQSACRIQYLHVLKRLAETYKRQPWGWVWVEAGAQPTLEETLEIGGSGYPSLAAVNLDKMSYSVLKGPFTEKGITDFISGLSYRVAIVPSRLRSSAALPPIRPVEPWDGEDAELPVEEEDIDDFELNDLDSDEKDEL